MYESGITLIDMSKLKEFIYRQVQKRHPHAARYQSYRSAKRILLLFESEPIERNLQIKALIKQMQEDGKEVVAWGYVNKKQPESAVLRDYRVLAQQDFNIWGLPKEYERQDLTREHYDMLIDLNVNNLLPLRYLNLYANVDFRAGRQTDEPYLNDFMIDIKAEKNPAFLFDQIIHYLKQIESKQ